jgi:predicted MFS family arabinose efflux permease
MADGRIAEGGAVSGNSRAPWVLMIAAATILSITMGIRQSLGLFVLPIVAATGVSLVSISFALAIGQFVWGAVQPVAGVLADQYGAYRVLIAGAVLLAAGAALAPWNSSELGFAGSLGILVAAGTAAGSFAILIGVTAQSLPMHERSLAAGYINAGGSVGQLLFAPLAQLVIGRWGWSTGMFAISAAALMTIPFAWLFRKTDGKGAGAASASATVPGGAAPLRLGEQLRLAARDRSYWFLHAGFFTCGFHIAFLVTHFPGELKMCGLSASVAANSLAIIGLCNFGGSVLVGWLGGRYRMKNILACLYASRALVIVCYLVMPKTAFNVYLVAGALGFSWLATVPPTAGLVGKLFGTRYLTTLFGLTLLSHQIGGFLGAWLGGVAMTQLGSYRWMWYADIALALFAALINLPIREAAPVRALEQPAPA